MITEDSKPCTLFLEPILNSIDNFSNKFSYFFSHGSVKDKAGVMVRETTIVLQLMAGQGDHQHYKAAVRLNQFKHQVEILFVRACVNMYLSCWITEAGKLYDLPQSTEQHNESLPTSTLDTLFICRAFRLQSASTNTVWLCQKMSGAKYTVLDNKFGVPWFGCDLYSSATSI